MRWLLFTFLVLFAALTLYNYHWPETLVLTALAMWAKPPRQDTIVSQCRPAMSSPPATTGGFEPPPMPEEPPAGDISF